MLSPRLVKAEVDQAKLWSSAYLNGPAVLGSSIYPLRTKYRVGSNEVILEWR